MRPFVLVPEAPFFASLTCNDGGKIYLTSNSSTEQLDLSTPFIEIFLASGVFAWD